MPRGRAPGRSTGAEEGCDALKEPRREPLRGRDDAAADAHISRIVVGLDRLHAQRGCRGDVADALGCREHIAQDERTAVLEEIDPLDGRRRRRVDQERKGVRRHSGMWLWRNILSPVGVVKVTLLT